MPLSRSILIALTAALLVHAQPGTENGEWRFYGGDARNTKYSPLAQIDAANFKNLTVAWRWSSRNFAATPEFTTEVTPLMAGGRLYFTATSKRAVVSVDAATGETLWTYRIDEPGHGMVRPANRGLSYWTDGREERVLVVSPGYQLLALDAKTGQPIVNFGTNGRIDLKKGLDRDKVEPGKIGATSPPIIIKDVAVVGAALGVGVRLPTIENIPGYIRGFDVRTGKLLWTFKTVPRPGEFGNDTWLDGSWQKAGNTGAWGPLTADEELGYVYIPVEMPSGDLYGGHRPGNNLFGNSLVCLDVKTGKRVWHYQLIHHDMWDWDIPAAPVLLDVMHDGKRVKAVAQVTKQAFTYVFDRVTGQPLWPIEERPVPKGDAPGEWYSPTQPFPTKPKPFDRQGVTEADLADYTPEIKAEALKVASAYKLGPIFSPPIVFDAGGKKGQLMLPGAGGGANWQSAAGDAETGILYIPSSTQPYSASLVHDEKVSEMRMIAGPGGVDSVFGLPLIKPPYGRIAAYDLNTGDEVFMVPNGEVAANIKNNPKLAGVDTSQWGSGDKAGLLVTKTLLIATNGANSPAIRALDKKSGKEIARATLPARATAPPMTYMINGRQYIVVAIGDRNFPAEMVALSLPPARPATQGAKPAAQEE